VGVTDDGRRTAAEVSRTAEQVREELRAGISRSERKQLAETLLRVQRNIAAIQAAHDADQ
jgi:DNA-binding MarR family transcriptional regulator